MSSDPALLAVHQISKSYGHVQALSDVSTAFRRGEIHAVLGENGSGKSTLIKILSGLLTPDQGRLSWQGTDIGTLTPAQARDLGIATVFQHFGLIERLSIIENCALSLHQPVTKDLRRRLEAQCEAYGFKLQPDRWVLDLDVAEKQQLEIIRNLLRTPTILLLDEPTSVLPPQSCEQLFRALRKLADENVALVFISHKLDEVRELCDTATILRRGQVVEACNPRDVSTDHIIVAMTGASAPTLKHKPASTGTGAILSVRHLNRAGAREGAYALQNIDLQVHPGEIVGIAGISGHGQRELFDAISGEWSGTDKNAVSLHGKPIGTKGPVERRERGMAFSPIDRNGHAAVTSMDLVSNIMLSGHHARHWKGWLNFRKARRDAGAVIERHNVVASGTSAVASSLSGGNLQKFLVGRELHRNPDVLVIANPTWGVDVAAAAQIHQELRNHADAGKGLLLFSEDLDELLALSDRLYVLSEGRLSDAISREDASKERLGELMLRTSAPVVEQSA